MNKPTLSIIAVISEKKRALGRENGLLWHVPGDLPRFKRITMGFPIIMGRKTFESIGRVLPGRTNIIVTRDIDYKVENAVVVNNIDTALIKAKFENDQEIFVIGGGEIFRHTLDMTDKLYLTLVKDEPEDADVFFPEYDNFRRVEDESEWIEGNGLRYKYITLTR